MTAGRPASVTESVKTGLIPQAGATSVAPAAQVEHIVKRFGHRQILSDVSLAVERGQVHALVGSNGAGKSSLVKILAGYYSPDGGRVIIGGVPVPPHGGVGQMAALGVRVVHQDLGLIDGMSITENVVSVDSYTRGRFGQIDWRATERKVEQALRLVGLDVSPADEVQSLATWQRVAVACARALYDGFDIVRLLILDEVTAALPPGEVALIIDIVHRLQALGAGIVYVTHRFEEITKVADWVSILRNGELIESRSVEGVTPADLVASVAGHHVEAGERSESRTAFGRPILELRSVSTKRLHGVSLTVRAGEVCGVIGRAGCGRSALGRAVFGLEAVSAGSIAIDGKTTKRASPRQAMRQGVAYVSQDRLRAGILPTGSVRENLTVASLDQVSRLGILLGGSERGLAVDLIRRYDIVPPSADEAIENLSGGNQQKAMVGRWGTRRNILFVFDEPTEGVDAGARRNIYEFIFRSVEDGAAVLLLTSSIEELVEICNRAYVLQDGRITHEIGQADISVPKVEHLLIAEA